MTTPAKAQMLFMARIGVDSRRCPERLFRGWRAVAHDVADAARRLEFALADDGHAVADGFHLAEFVRRKENGLALVFQALDDFADFHAAQRVQAAGRLVENQQIGIVDERLREADALLHAFGIGFDEAFAGGLQFNEFEQPVNAPVGFRARQAENAGVKPQQFLGGEKFVVISHLRQIADALARDGLAHVNAKQLRRAAGRRHKAEQDVDGRGFARAVRPEKAEDFAGAHLEIEPASATLVDCRNSRLVNSTRSFSVLK